MRNIPPIRALQAFEAAARHLSVARAAEELHVTPSAVSHQVKALETHLKMPLFYRFPRRLVLTDTGQSFLESLTRAFDRIDDATRQLLEGGGGDVLTVHCPPSFAPAWLSPRIPGFMQAHPRISLRLHATPDPPRFFNSDTDVEIRSGDGDWPGLIVVELMPDTLIPLVSPALKDRHGPQLSAEDLTSLPLIHSERAPIKWVDWFRARGIAAPHLGLGLRFDRGYLSIGSAVAGLGVALESTVFAERELQSGELVPAIESPDAEARAGGHYLVYPETFGKIPKVAAFHEWIVNQR